MWPSPRVASTDRPWHKWRPISRACALTAPREGWCGLAAFRARARRTASVGISCRRRLNTHPRAPVENAPPAAGEAWGFGGRTGWLQGQSSQEEVGGRRGAVGRDAPDALRRRRVDQGDRPPDWTDRNTVRRAAGWRAAELSPSAAGFQARSVSGGDPPTVAWAPEAAGRSGPWTDRAVGLCGLEDDPRRLPARGAAAVRAAAAGVSGTVYRPGELCRFDLWQPREPIADASGTTATDFGWQLVGHMRTTLVLDALRMALISPVPTGCGAPRPPGGDERAAGGRAAPRGRYREHVGVLEPHGGLWAVLSDAGNRTSRAL